MPCGWGEWLMRTRRSSRTRSAKGLLLSVCAKPSLMRKVYALKGSHSTEAAMQQCPQQADTGQGILSVLSVKEDSTSVNMICAAPPTHLLGGHAAHAGGLSA